MAKVELSRVETLHYENLINDNKYPILTAARELNSGAGALKRGTALQVNADGATLEKMTNGGTASAILAEDAAGGGVAVVYLTGQFNRQKVDEITGINESLESQGMTVEVVGEGNKLIYNYYYTELVNQEGLGEALEEGLTAEADTFSDVAASISEAVDVENPVVVVRYIDANGEVIHSQEFPAQ